MGLKTGHCFTGGALKPGSKKVEGSQLQAVEAHRRVPCEVVTSATFKSKAIPVTGRGGPWVFPVR
jgi:hypothetical protein